MDLEEELVEIDRVGVGLERSHITNEGQIELPERGPESSDSGIATVQHAVNHVLTDTRSTTHRVFGKIKSKKHCAGIKIRDTLHIERPVDEDKELGTRSLVLVDTADVKQSKSRLDNKSTASEKRTVKEFFNCPIDTLKHKGWCQGNQEVAAKIAVSEISHGQEVDLVNAYSVVGQAETQEERQTAEEGLSEMLKQRQSTYVRWSLDRHVTKISVLPQNAIVAKPRSDFERKNKHGDTSMEWSAYGTHLADCYGHRYGRHYIGYGSEPPVPCKETIMPSVERLIVATCPLQEFIMTARRIYRWERPSETGKFLLVYVVLWHLNLLLPGVLSAILYLVAARRWHTQTIDDLREEIRQREDIHKTASSLTDFIEKRGDDNWAHDLLQELGPWLMIQLSDLANFFESMRNFYEWRVPLRTFSVLVVFASAILVTAFTPSWLLAKMSTFSAGFVFFALFPISVNYPKYRLLVSPSKWLFWNIPTHAEWAIKYIKAEGSRVLAEYQQSFATETSSANPISFDKSLSHQDHEFASYTAHYEKSAGNLIISATGLRFVSKHTPRETQFALPYSRIQNLEKQDRHVERMMKILKECEEDLRLVDCKGRERVLRGVERRNEAFSQIVGFSQTTWQVVW